MRDRRKRRAAAPNDVAVVKVWEDERDFRGEAYYVAIVEAVDRMGTPTSFLRGHGIAMPADFALDHWTEPADKYDVARLRRRLEKDPPQRMYRLGEVRFFLERYQVEWTATGRARPTPIVAPSVAAKLVSVPLARRLKELGAPRFTSLFWCRKRREKQFRLQVSRSGCEEWLPAYSVRDLMEMLPEKLELGGETYELEVDRDDEGYVAMYPGVYVAQAAKLADALAIVAIHLRERG